MYTYRSAIRAMFIYMQERPIYAAALSTYAWLGQPPKEGGKQSHPIPSGRKQPMEGRYPISTVFHRGVVDSKFPGGAASSSKRAKGTRRLCLDRSPVIGATAKSHRGEEPTTSYSNQRRALQGRSVVRSHAVGRPFGRFRSIRVNIVNPTRGRGRGKRGDRI